MSNNWKPHESLTVAPTNLKEAIDWVLRVTGRDGKKLDKDKGECICGLASAVTDLLQSVQLEYHGYDGDGNISNGNKSPQKCFPELFSLVQGPGGTSVVRTYIDQLAQVLSALVGWSRIVKCEGKGGKCNVNASPHGDSNCTYLQDKDSENKCNDCGCMKYVVIDRVDWVQLGRGCTRCKDSGSSDKKQTCECSDGGSCTADSCECAKAGKCCKCCCKDKCGTCKKECICDKEKYKCHEEEKKKNGDHNDEYKIECYMSAYAKTVFESFTAEANITYRQPTWHDLKYLPDSDTPSNRRHQCARILLGSVCLIWSGLTYMHWTGKWTGSSPYWNNHILDGSGLDDGSLSQWLQALGFPKAMLNDHGPKNRLDQVIWDGFMGKLFLGFTHPKGCDGSDGITAKQPFWMNYAGFVHTAHRDSFNKDARVFKNGTTSGTTGRITETNQDKIGAIFKLYILSCAYFTGLQKKTSESTTNVTKNPKTIREILYWLSALPYSQAYKRLLDHSKGVLIKVAPDVEDKKQLSFLQQGRTHPITVHQYNLFAHFQAVTQYCPLVLIGIQGGIHSPKGTDSTKELAIHALYANTECNFTYPTVSIQAYNQVVHYIRGLFYQLYFLRKQCAVKVTCGGKWRECRYGDGVVSKGVISWMCLGCNPMDHDRKSRVDGVKKTLDGVKGGVNSVPGALKELLSKIGEVVVQLGNAQEALERKAESKVIDEVKKKLGDAKKELDKARTELETAVKKVGAWVEQILYDAKEKLEDLTKNSGGSGILKDLESKLNGGDNIDPGKNKISEAIKGVRNALDALKEGVKELKNEKLSDHLDGQHDTLLNAVKDILDIAGSSKCAPCQDHSNKCGKLGEKKTCEKCHQQYMDGTPSPLQAFLEDRLPGFSCKEVLYTEDTDQPYPSAASHLGHCGGSGQCCPLPMGFRGHFHKGGISDMTGSRLYGILYFFSNENMMQSCVYTLVRVTAELSATTPQVLGDVFGFFRGGVGEKEEGMIKDKKKKCDHTKPSSEKTDDDYFCGWCASGLRDEVQKIEWIQKVTGTDDYRKGVGQALIQIKGDKDTTSATPSALSTLTKDSEYLSPLTGELYTAVSATFGGTYLSWVLYLSDALEGGLRSLSEAFRNIECRGCKGQCDPNKCKKGSHGDKGSGQCKCQSIVSCTGVLPVLYRHGFSYGNPFNLEGYTQKDEEDLQFDIENKKNPKHCHGVR